MEKILFETASRVRAFMRESLEEPANERWFNTLALELFEGQRQSNSAYANLCRGRGDGGVSVWQDIPAVPTVAFKELDLTSLKTEERQRVFLSSGTTQNDRSRHYHSEASLALYEDSAWLWFNKNFAERSVGLESIFLTPGAADAPNSSLVHMFETIATRRQRGNNEFVGTVNAEGAWDLKTRRLIDLLRRAESQGKGVALFGTAFLFIHLLDDLGKEGEILRLPKNSWVIETGGYKGLSREVPKEELRRLIMARLGIPAERVFGEYGMSELSSQAYDRADGLFCFPPWARARIISPATGREAREGEPGLIRVYDLANLWSVMAAQTEDIGIKVGDGFQLCGRAAQAEARGCSLMSA